MKLASVAKVLFLLTAGVSALPAHGNCSSCKKSVEGTKEEVEKWMTEHKTADPDNHFGNAIMSPIILEKPVQWPTPKKDVSLAPSI
jgi:hypothetical protein